jgi:hypothetical protein
LQVEFNTSGSYVTAYEILNGDLGPDNACAQTCVDLTALDPLAAMNPNLLIRFTWMVEQRRFEIDNIEVRGSDARCDAVQLGIFQLSPVTALGGGNYQLDVFLNRGRTTQGTLECTWNSGGAPVRGNDALQFQF